MNDELNARKLKILQAVIDDYILNAMPVGSGTISKKYLEWSSATIRNEMSELEEMGYLDQPHTSSGRIPSQKAYRLYVNHMLTASNLSQGEARQLRGFLDRRLGEVDTVIEQAAHVLTELTNYPSMVLKPQMKQARITHLQMVPVSRGTALLVIVTEAGILSDTLIRVPEDIDNDRLYMLSKMLDQCVQGQRVQDVGQILSQTAGPAAHEHREFLSGVLRTAEEKIQRSEANAVVLGGTASLLNFPEYSDIGKAKAFLRILENKDLVYKLLSRATEMELSISIGRENDIEEMSEASIVTATYRVGDSTVGSFGVIGPMRMDYRNVINVLGYIGGSLSEILKTISNDRIP